MTPPLLSLLLACGPGKSTKHTDTTQKDSDTSVTQDTDTGPVGTDNDGDGWTVEQGDCDDDNIYVNPGWTENTTDGIDNDCDTRIDEKWSGLTVVWTNGNGAASLLTVDTLGNETGELELDSECAPNWIDHGLTTGWVTSDGSAVSLISTGGSCVTLADFSDTDYGVFGVAYSPAGYYVATTLDSLVRIDTDGTITTLASWDADWTNTDTFQLAVYTIAVDLRNNTVGLFDYFGGFATYDDTNGLVIEKQADPTATTLQTYSGTARDGGGWAVAAVDTSGAYGIYDFDADAGDWSLTSSWTDDQYTPAQITTDGDSGDAYATATAGWFCRIWRVREVDGEVNDLYETDGTEEYRSFAGIVANYD